MIRKILKSILACFSFLLLFLGSLLLFTALWVRRTWKSLSFSTIIFQLENSLSGTGNHMISTYILTAALPAVGLFVLILTAHLLLSRWDLLPKKTNKDSKEATAPLFFRPGFRLILVLLTGLLLAALSLLLLWKPIGLGNYLKYGRKNSHYIENNYVNPKDVALSFPQIKRNLIYIYLESMELTYEDRENGGIMEESLIPKLTGLAKSSACFAGENGAPNGALSLYGTDWTMGAMFAETSGLPLIIPIQRNSMFTQDQFFPTVTTLGDILTDAGYHNVFLLGSDAQFGGRDLYYSTHGNYEIQDYHYARESGRIPEDYMVFWGYEDEKLFQFAKEELAELSQEEEPFNLTLLTVDTHFEDGYTCRLCEGWFDDPYENVIACSDRQAAAFVAWCQTQDFYDNTTIIISGDHPTMDRDYCRKVPDDLDRKVFISIINPAIEAENCASSRLYSTFDLFPTTLSSLGVDIPGHRLGLGTDLFSGQPTLLERDGLTEMNTQLMMHSDFMTKLADIDPVSDDIFLQDVDQILMETDITLSLEETTEKGGYLAKATLLTDRPSSINYIGSMYITAYDGTYHFEIPLEKDEAASREEGKTIFTAPLHLPLTEDRRLRLHHSLLAEDSPSEQNGTKPAAEKENTEDETTGASASQTGNIHLTLSMETSSGEVLSQWEADFPVSY